MAFYHLSRFREIDDGNLESRQSNGVFVSQTSFQKNRISNHTKLVLRSVLVLNTTKQ